MPSGVFIRTEEYCKKMSEVNRKRWENPEFKLKMSKRFKGIKRTKGKTWKVKDTSKMGKGDIRGEKNGNWGGKSFTPEVIEKIRIAKINNPNHVYYNTIIEQMVEKVLNDRNIRYLKNINVDDIANVDFFLLGYDIVIFCDGCYWHSCKTCNKRNDKRRKRIDLIQTKKLLDKGYKVYRFWEHEIKKSPEECVDRIVEVT